jgi:hypothetical protein
MNLDFHNFIDTFLDVGMTDPFHSLDSFYEAFGALGKYMFDKDVYSKAIMKALAMAFKQGQNSVRPPKCTFLPSEKMCRTMIRALLLLAPYESKHDFLLRFSLIDHLKLAPPQDEE